MDVSRKVIGERLRKKLKPDAVVVEVEQKPLMASEEAEEKSEEMSSEDKAALMALYEKYC